MADAARALPGGHARSTDGSETLLTLAPSSRSKTALMDWFTFPTFPGPADQASERSSEEGTGDRRDHHQYRHREPPAVAFNQGPWSRMPGRSSPPSTNPVMWCTGKMARFANFGAFVELDDNLEGLCHISELSEERVAKPEDVVQLGQEMDFKILRIDPETKKIGLFREAVGKDEADHRYEDLLLRSRRRHGLARRTGRLRPQQAESAATNR